MGHIFHFDSLTLHALPYLVICGYRYVCFILVVLVVLLCLFFLNHRSKHPKLHNVRLT